MPLILSTCKTLTHELGPNMSLTFWKEREEKLKLRTETQEGARKCQLLLAHFVTMFWQLEAVLNLQMTSPKLSQTSRAPQ